MRVAFGRLLLVQRHVEVLGALLLSPTVHQVPWQQRARVLARVPGVPLQ